MPLHEPFIQYLHMPKEQFIVFSKRHEPCLLLSSVMENFKQAELQVFAADKESRRCGGALDTEQPLGCNPGSA